MSSQSPQQPAQHPLQALMCLSIVSSHFNVSFDPVHAAHSLGLEGRAASIDDLKKAAKEAGLKASKKRVNTSRLEKLSGPFIAIMNDGRFGVVFRSNDEKVLAAFPPQGGVQPMEREAFVSEWSGEVILIKQPLSLTDENRRFDFFWFLPVLFRFRSTLYEILLAAFVIQLFAIAMPLFSQVLIDKVLTHNSISTLHILALGMLGVIAFNGILEFLKTLLMAHTTKRIDVVLGSRLFGHLVKIPLRYFETRRVGETIARAREMDQVRQFLTGQTLTTAIDCLFIFIFIALMLLYSVKLTMVVLLAIPFFVLITGIIRPIMRRKLDDLFEKNAASQSFLVESITGIQTVKAMALEPSMTKKWGFLLARYVHAAKGLQVLGGLATSLSQVVQKVTTLAIYWVGAYEVMQNRLTVGQLIAFNMIAGQVINPVMKLVQLWQDFQEVGLAIDRLGDVMNTHAEPTVSHTSSAELKGHVEVDNVVFRYTPDGKPILNKLTVDIPAGTTVGIVGRSGSGKSTLTKLLQRLYLPEQGRVLVDNIDIAQADPQWLRRQVGVVLQENFLFSGSVRENIAAQWPSAPMEAIIRVAKMAGAHDFIQELDGGYDSQVGERGTALSGGQRQRVAIARALLTSPSILILDEATSALDYESERIIQNNMQHICKGRTVFIIAHRLSTILHADTILVMDKGELVEQGSHQDLIAKKGLYHYLFSQQGTELGYSTEPAKQTPLAPPSNSTNTEGDA